MSHREGYYVKMLRKEDARACKNIDAMFKKQPKRAEVPELDKLEIKSKKSIKDGSLKYIISLQFYALQMAIKS
jgi:hypothetical protein